MEPFLFLSQATSKILIMDVSQKFAFCCLCKNHYGAAGPGFSKQRMWASEKGKQLMLQLNKALVLSNSATQTGIVPSTVTPP